MEHKAFAFDWKAFQRHLAPILHDALSSDSIAGLAAFIEHHRPSLSDPYEGEPLPEHWSSLMENRDVQDHGDFALTLYYSLAFGAINSQFMADYRWNARRRPYARSILICFPRKAKSCRDFAGSGSKSFGN